jgi:hypothetical protein
MHWRLGILRLAIRAILVEVAAFVLLPAAAPARVVSASFCRHLISLCRPGERVGPRAGGDIPHLRASWCICTATAPVPLSADSAPLPTIAFIPEPPDGWRLHRRPSNRADQPRSASQRTIAFGPKSERGGRRMQGAQGGRPVHFVYRHVVGDDPAYGEVGRSLGAAAQRLAELRKAVDPGMGGRNSRSMADRPQLAASVATGIALFLLG